MAPKNTYRVEKLVKRLQTISLSLSLDTEAGRNQIEKLIKELEDEKDAPEHLAARDLTSDEVVKIFGLKEEVQQWYLQKGGIDIPESLTFVRRLIKDAPFDKKSERYSRLTIDHMIMACFAQLKENLSKQSELSTNDPATTTSPILKQSELSTNDPTPTTSAILKQSELSTNDPTTTTSPILKQSKPPTKDSHNQITPTTPSKTPESTSQPLPIKVFHKMPLSVQIKRSGMNCVVSGIADWAMRYGDRAGLENGTVLLAVEAKQEDLYSSTQGQLLAYLAIIRQLRIQANKENVMTQGFYSDGINYTFICIRNDGTIMESISYKISFPRHLKAAFNFLLNMLTTAANSSPNTSPMKPGKEWDEKITNLDQDIFVRVIEDQDMYDDTGIAEEECITKGV